MGELGILGDPAQLVMAEEEAKKETEKRKIWKIKGK